jgi:hypothetical protein
LENETVEKDDEDEDHDRKMALVKSKMNSSEFDLYHKNCENPPLRVKKVFEGYTSLDNSYEAVSSGYESN